MKLFNTVLIASALAASFAQAETRVDGLVTITPEWHEAIAAGECLNQSGFGPCAADDTFGPAPDGRVYQGPTQETSRLLTRFNIYSEECRGAVGQANIEGWCAKRDEARERLAANGVCLGDNGFHLCAPVTEGDLPIFGTWNCGGTTTVIDATTYTTVQTRRIEQIQESNGSFLVLLDNGSRFAAFDVTATFFIWHSPQSEDTFVCRKQ